ncbi:MAG: alkaline phosphatase family protein [Planctomycetes bacterium]|nr:alkaline phosphatase family protein [Planctomycetota bacterium]
MKSRSAIAVVVALLLGTAPAQGEPPRLVVLCSVDQLARWVFDQGLPHLPADGGFRRLLAGGAHFVDCAYQHACTETGPGHATIGTGAPAAGHGIVRNSWWSAADRAVVYCAEQPMPPLPELPEAKDRGPGRLLLPTLGDGLKAHVRGSKVVGVAWKDRAAILMAGRSADAVVWFEAQTGNLVTNTAWTQELPEWIAAFNRERRIDGFHGWIWDRCGPASAYAGLVDDRPYEVPHQNGSNGRTLPQPIHGGASAPGPAFYAQAYASPLGNTMVRLAAEAALDALELGLDATPDLLCVSFSATDVIGHQFGPDSVEARDALLRLDRDLALLLEGIERRVGAGRYAVFLTADHGVGPTPEWAREQGVDAGRGALRKDARAAAEKALSRAFGAPPSGKRWFAHVDGDTFCLDPEVLEAVGGAGDAATLRRLAARTAAAAAAATAGVQAAYATEDLLLQSAAHDPLRTALLHALCPGRTGDVVLVGKPYWLDGRTPASHGTPHPYDREVVALAMGPGVPPGSRFAAPITPGFGVVLFAAMLGVPRPPGAVDPLPAGLLGTR